MKKKSLFLIYPFSAGILTIFLLFFFLFNVNKQFQRMSLNIKDSIFDESSCTCDTLLNKLNYLIKNGVGGTVTAYFPIELKIEDYTNVSEFPGKADLNDIAIIPMRSYPDLYIVSGSMPGSGVEGMIWIQIDDQETETYITSEIYDLPIGGCYQYIHGNWQYISAFVFVDGWKQFSYDQDNWQKMAELAGVNIQNYATLDNLIADHDAMKQIFLNASSFRYLINNPNLSVRIRSSPNYDAIIRSYYVMTTTDGITNKQKYDLGLPCYLFQNGYGTRTELVDWTVIASNGSNSSTIDKNAIALSVSDNGATYGMRQIRSTVPVNLSKYSKIYFDYQASGNSGTSSAYIQFENRLSHGGSQTVSRRTVTLDTANDYLYFYVYVQENSHYQNLTIYNIYVD